MAVRDEAVTAQLERILNSETFRNAEVLKRLLRFLAEKSLSGQADQLKEYSIGIDALGKPDTYNPREDSVVRIQVGRLRQKLADYYHNEGGSDEILLDLPKGRFKLNWVERSAAGGASDGRGQAKPARTTGKRLTRVLAVVAAVAVFWAAIATVLLVRERKASGPFRAAWTPELGELWQPFLTSDRPALVSVSTPLFVALQGAGLYRDLSLNKWEDVEKSPRVEAVRKALGAAATFPRYNYSAIGTVNSAFHLGKLLAITDVKVSLARTSQLSWQQMADNNVILIGGARAFAAQLRGLPIEMPILLEERGVRNLRPQAGQPATLSDDFPPITDEPPSGQPDDGELYAVVTHAPGPLGFSCVRSFNSNHSPGTLGAVQAFTAPSWAGTLVAAMRKPGGEMPRYYQVVLKVKYKDAVPTEISYVLHHELRPNRVTGTAPKM
jgi:hypothetical protein